MIKLLTVLGLSNLVPGLQLRRTEPVSPENAEYSCANTTDTFRNDISIEFFTSNRQPDDPDWPMIRAQVPKSYGEFMCAVANMNPPPSNCTTDCAYLLAWQDPCMRTFKFEQVHYDTDVVFLDMFKRVISINPRKAKDSTSLTSTSNMAYALIVPTNSLSPLGVKVGDPAKIPSFQPIVYLGGSVMAPQGVEGMHN